MGRIYYYLNEERWTPLEILWGLAYLNDPTLPDSKKNEELRMELLDTVMNYGIVRNRIENYMPYKMYGNYGKTELECIYCDELLSLDKYIAETKQELRNAFLLLDFNKFDDNEDPMASPNLFLSKFLSFTLKDINKKIVYRYAKQVFPDLTIGQMQMYVRIRKRTNYKAELSMSNQEIFDLLNILAPDMKKPTWGFLNKIKESFGYKSEINVARIEYNNFVKNHRNQINFWKKYGACFIEESSYQMYCSILKVEYDLSNEEYSDLLEWCLKCKNDGIYRTSNKNNIAIRMRAIKDFGFDNDINIVFMAGIPSRLYEELGIDKFSFDKKYSIKEIMQTVA